jgi:hypothetical protein
MVFFIYNSFTERTNRRMKTTMPRGYLLDILLGSELWVLFHASLLAQNRIRIGIRQMVFKRLAQEKGVFYTIYIVQKEQIAGT